MISPTLACVDYLNMGRDIRAMDAAGVDLYHIDLMDGHYVPNLCLNFDIIHAVRGISPVPMDAHLMVTNPMDYLDRLAQAEVRYACAHPDACDDVDAFLAGLRRRGIKAGLALAPGAGLEQVLPYLEKLDYLLLLFVQPGFAGQAFMPEVLDKLCQASALRAQRGLGLQLFCDGGIGWDDAAAVAAAGGDVLVAGAFTVFERKLPLEEACRRLMQLAGGAAAPAARAE